MKNVIIRQPGDEVEPIGPDELISVEEEAALVRIIQQDEGDVDGAKEKLMHASQRFVRSVARKYVSPKFTLEELMAEGNKGLEAAIAKFDETRGFKFISYAVWWIRQSIEQYVLEKEKVGLEFQCLSARELDILRMYLGIGQAKATPEEIQAKYNLTPQRVMAIKDQVLRKLFKSRKDQAQ